MLNPMVPQDKKKAMLIDVDSSNSYWKNWENSFHLRCLLSVIPPYLCRSFLKNHKRGGLKIFLQKKEENNPYMGVVCRKGQHCFLLVMYGFYSKNPLYSASLLFTMFSFFYSFWYQKLLLIRIKSHCGVAYRSM